jgi:chemotaxis protein methyltransferase CheR
MTLTSQEFAFISGLVRRDSAIVLDVGKEYLVEARLLPLARQSGLPSVSEFVNRAQQRPEPEVYQKIVDALTTNETSWFRDADPFTTLTHTILPDLMPTRAKAHTLRVWSAACSTGQEPYSISMALQDAIPGGWSYEILATDISAEVLNRAEQGLFTQLEVNRGLPAAMLVRHFERDGPSWRVAQSLRRPITFKRLNLAAPLPSLPPFDVIFLRNVLIYFDVDTKRSVLQRVTSMLRPDGWLFLGAAETTLGIDDRFERIPAGRASAYRLRAGKIAAPVGAQERG